MAIMFKYLITVQPLGFMYGSAGAFLSPENLVGKSGSKFPPDAATLSGLFFSSNKDQQFANNEELRDELYVAGPFWSMVGNEEYFYVPLPRHKVIGEDDNDEWLIKSYNWCLKSKAETVEEQPSEKKKESEYHWLKIDYWHSEPQEIQENRNANPPSVAAKCWEYLPILHPQIKKDERHVLPEDGLFLETAVQMKDDTCLVYLSTYPLTDGWYQFGGESHIVEIKSIELPDDSPILELLRTPIKRTFALITPGLWGSNHCSYRYPKQPDFSTDNNKIKLLTDKAVPYRYRIGYGDQKKEEYSTRTQGRLSRGRYAVPVGSVYALKDPLNKNWWDFPQKWFPEKGLLKKFGCGLCLPIKVQGVDD
jgi:CRISPR-associated protein Cmr3